MFTFARNSKVLRTTAILALGLAGLSAHADNVNPVLGGGLGAMAGALIGQSVGGRDGAMIGAAVGGVAGVSIASDGQRRYSEAPRNVVYQQPRTVVYEPPYRPAPVYAPVYAPVPVYGYREVERVTYYPVHDYGRPGWGRHGHDERRWEHDGDRHGGEHRGWDRRD
ncbi:MAG: hypothetical protein HXX19_10320 [Rhodoferax sp.]|nr:hypothetical protein [Rhodoferax sp.]